MKQITKPFMAFLLTAFLSLFCLNSHAGDYHRHLKHNPLIFVHGGAGSASQFESQAMRLASNGYRLKQLFALEYDSSFSVDTMASVYQRLDALVDKALAVTGKEQVDLMGHSLGTLVLNGYLSSSPERAARTSKFINLDGYSTEAQPGDVPTLALWAEIGQGGFVGGGATNITIEGQTHVETATSAESFHHIYTFLTGKEPRTTNIRPTRRPIISIAGRAVYFPQNTGVDGATVEIYEVYGDTGQRKKQKPKAVFEIDESGNWGPFYGRKGRYYEFVIAREGQDHHIYKEAFLRDDHFVRLLTSPVGGGVGANMDTAPSQSNLIISRDKEFWGELPMGNDILAINGISVVNASNSPFSNRTTAMYFFDANSDEQSDLSQPLDYFHGLPFITGNDLFIAADEQAQGRIRLALTPRGKGGLMQVLNIPNWPSTTDRVTVLFNDFTQGDSFAH